jgi:hypothetical protein
MSLTDWIHKYPQVQALLQQPGEELAYAPDVDEPPPSTCVYCNGAHDTDLVSYAFVPNPAIPGDAGVRGMLCQACLAFLVDNGQIIVHP